MSNYSPRAYWSKIATNFGHADPNGFAPVLHPDSPPWFNRQIDDLQFRAFRRALALAAIPAHSRVLDIGCGTGRWIRRYGEFGLRTTGVDATHRMLRIARLHGTTGPLVTGEAVQLPMADRAFDCVSDITVVQHIPPPLQSDALAEMLRVLKPGGCLILMELIRGAGAHIFPRSPKAWIHEVTSRGATLITWFGQEFLLADRIFVHLARTLSGVIGGHTSCDPPSPTVVQEGSFSARRAYWALRRISVGASVWTESVAERILPGHLATHGVFVFRK